MKKVSISIKFANDDSTGTVKLKHYLTAKQLTEQMFYHIVDESISQLILADKESRKVLYTEDGNSLNLRLFDGEDYHVKRMLSYEDLWKYIVGFEINAQEMSED